MAFKDAAALSYNYLTAYILLYEFGNVKSGQTVLFHSAGGGVGVALTQLTKLVSNLTVIATCSKNKFDALKHHITHLFDENGCVDYSQEIKKFAIK
jgi:NADPH:quinone reductase-like Zn-dependent oxidoreductase